MVGWEKAEVGYIIKLALIAGLDTKIKKVCETDI
jgi:hypothetical protein